jgi:hypothetical protein
VNQTQAVPTATRRNFAARIFFASVILLCVAVVSLCAEPAGISAGGAWMEYDRVDPMTGYNEARFALTSTNMLRDGKEKALVQIFCNHGKYKQGDFHPNGRLGRPEFPGFWGQPQMRVYVRADDRHFHRDWNWHGDSLAMDKDTVRAMIGAQIFNVEFRTPRGPQIAEFSPSGLDQARFHDQCHLTPKKPLSDE